MSAPDESLAAEILAQFTETSSARFDNCLETMPLDDAQRRELRYWQRQSLSALRQYAALALPGVLTVIGAAQRETAESVESAARAWDERRPEPATAPPTPPEDLELRRRTVAARLASGA